MAAHSTVVLDLGTGDGRSLIRAARRSPHVLFLGIDADASRMRRASAHAPANARFVLAAAEALPTELDSAITVMTVQFPWGSLLDALIRPRPATLAGIARVLSPGGVLTALIPITDRDGREPIGPGTLRRGTYADAGLEVREWRPATRDEVVRSDSSWAKRLRAADRRPVWKLIARSQCPATSRTSIV